MVDKQEKAATAIWKYALHGPAVSKVGDLTTITMPRGATVLDVQNQQGIVCLWVETVPDLKAAGGKQTRCFRWVETGKPVPTGGEYLGTVQLDDGNYVVHIYEVAP